MTNRRIGIKKRSNTRILVFADDFTGAAEIGGVGLRYGLSVEVLSGIGIGSGTDLVVIDTDTRSLKAVEARLRILEMAQKAAGVPDLWVYKKTDSVLRGHAAVEIEALLSALGKTRALLVPANPSSGRIISGGRYYIQNIPLHETDFSRDPEYPALSSDVLELHGASSTLRTQVLKPGQDLLGEGIFIGEAVRSADLRIWAGKVDDRTLPAGGAEFFAAVLEEKGFKRIGNQSSEGHQPKEKKALFICGSASIGSRRSVEEAMQRGIPVFEIPVGTERRQNNVSGIPSSAVQADASIDSALEEWLEKTVRAVENHNRVIVSIPASFARNQDSVRDICSVNSLLVSHVLKRTRVDELFIEGGSTASRIVGRMGWKRFIPCAELAPGVIRMNVQGMPAPVLTLKPGSYPWPEAVWG